MLMSTTQLGRTRVDPYAWLRDPDYQKVLSDPSKLRPAIRAVLDAENAYCDAVLKPTGKLQAQLIAEMRRRIDPRSEEAAVPDGPWLYYSRFAEGSDQPIYLRRPRAGGPEQVLLDAQAMKAGKTFFAVDHVAHSADHRLFAWTVDEAGSERYRLEVRDLATGALLPEPPGDVQGSFVISPDSQWLFWPRRDARGRPSAILRRRITGGRPDEEVVYEEPDQKLEVTVSVTRDRAFIVITSANQQTSEVRVIPASDPSASPRLMQPRIDGTLYHVDRWNGRFVVLTNADGAVDYKLCWADDRDLSKAGWHELVPHRRGRYIAAVAPFRDHLVRLERADALDQIVILPRQSGGEHQLKFDEEAYALSLEPGFEYDTATLRYAYQSPVTPPQKWDYDMAARKKSLARAEKVPGYDPNRYVVRRLWAKAADGEQVPITAVMRKSTPTDGSAPLHLFGYGAYGYAIEPNFSNANICLLDRGWICATAHIRGGSEKGWAWFLDGRKFKKKNTFTDYIASAEHLCGIGWARKGRILAYGRSAGGMLMGAVLNMRPDLWAGVLAGVPFVDVINTMSDVTLPLTPPEWPEWGDPLTDPAAYDYMMSYSPYDNVRPLSYPPVLATCGLTDPRVTYWEPAKWVARLRHENRGPNPIMLHTNMGAGHKGEAGRYDALKEAALNHAFAIWAMDRKG
jgi:oligopeptidase B